MSLGFLPVRGPVEIKYARGTPGQSGQIPRAETHHDLCGGKGYAAAH